LCHAIDFACRRALEQLSAWLGQAAQEGRAALNSLRTATTQTNDLAEALRRVTEDGLIPGSMAVTFSVVGDAKEMHPIVRDEIYRIGYEAIRNACMHSGASQLEVELRYARDLGHFGLQGMGERPARIGGNLPLGSSSNSGTEIKLVVLGDIIFRKATRSQTSDHDPSLQIMLMSSFSRTDLVAPRLAMFSIARPTHSVVVTYFGKSNFHTG
jgi:signal transduction histidine kinase